MKSKDRLAVFAFTIATLGTGAGRATPEPKYLTRSIYVPVEFTLCEHLEKAVLYQDELPISTMPAKRIFQFTYYPDLGRLLPEEVQIRVEGTYHEGGDPFVARLAVSPAGVHTANRTKELPALETLQKSRHKIDVRLEERTVNLACPRFCRRQQSAANGQ